MRTATTRLRAARYARERWTRRVGLGIALLAMATAGVTLLRETQRQPKAALATNEPSAIRQLRAVLDRRRTCLVPGQHRMLLEHARLHIATLGPATLTVLGQPANALFPGAAALAADLPVEGSIDALQNALPQTKGAARVAALLAIDTLEPWPASELEAMLDNDEPQIVEAALKMVLARAALPLELTGSLLSTLRSEERKVRQLAFAAMPLELAEEHVPTLLALVDDFPDDAAIAALLGRVPPSEQGLAALLDRIDIADAAGIDRLAPALKRYAESPKIRTALWEVALGTDSVPRRARALYCLELVGARDGIPTQSAAFAPILQYHLARLRIAAGDVAGLDEMLVLASADEDPDEELRETSGHARLLLSKVARLAPHATFEELQAWRTGVAAAPRTTLPIPPL